LLDFHRRYYSANMMQLVVYGKEPLDTLTEWACGKFADVPNHEIDAPVTEGTPYGPTECLVRCCVSPPAMPLCVCTHAHSVSQRSNRSRMKSSSRSRGACRTRGTRTRASRPATCRTCSAMKARARCSRILSNRVGQTRSLRAVTRPPPGSTFSACT